MYISYVHTYIEYKIYKIAASHTHVRPQIVISKYIVVLIIIIIILGL